MLFESLLSATRSYIVCDHSISGEASTTYPDCSGQVLLRVAVNSSTVTRDDD